MAWRTTTRARGKRRGCGPVRARPRPVSTGTVSGEALVLAFGAARLPGTGEQLGGPWRAGGVIGFDATFSAPKSVSLLFALGDREVRAEVRAAHVTAVEDGGLAYLEEHAAFTRRGRNGVMISDTEGLVIARFEHRTSRALDPQLHSHCLILNKVRDAQDGSWRALHGRALFEEAKTAGMLYQAGLRAELTRRLGVVWGPVSEHGQAELAGIPHQLLARFSTRTVEVEAAAEAKIAELERALGRSLEADERGRVYRLAVVATRRSKTHDHVAEVGLYQRWASEARDAGWEAGAVVRAAIGDQHLGAPFTPAQVVSNVVSELCLERATFTRRDVVQAVTCQVVSHSTVRSASVLPRIMSRVNTVNPCRGSIALTRCDSPLRSTTRAWSRHGQKLTMKGVRSSGPMIENSSISSDASSTRLARPPTRRWSNSTLSVANNHDAAKKVIAAADAASSPIPSHSNRHDDTTFNQTSTNARSAYTTVLFAKFQFRNVNGTSKSACTGRVVTPRILPDPAHAERHV